MNYYFMRFPSVLKKALQSERIIFPECIMIKYEPLIAYRGIRIIPDSKITVTKEDFKSQVERNLPGTNFDDIGNYSCSCFMDMAELKAAFKLPRKNKGIAVGLIRDNYGPYILEDDSSHIHWFLYDGVDPSSDFKVIKDE